MAKRRMGAGLLVVALTGSAVVAGTQDPIELELPAAVREAQAIVLAAYPELRAVPLAWRTSATEDGFELAAYAGRAPFEDPTEVPALVATRAALDLDGRVQALALDGALTGRARLQTLQQRAATEPAATVVREAGGQYVPGEEVAARALVGEALARASRSGPVADVQFGVLGEPGADGMTWRVELEGPSRADPRTVLVFEPVEGRLVGLVRR